MEKLQRLISLCKCGVKLEVNPHRDYYETAGKWIADLEEREDRPSDLELDDDIRARMIATDTIIQLQFYPDTPIGFFRLLHYDLDAVIDVAIDCIKSKKGTLAE